MEQRVIVVSDKCVRIELKLVSTHLVMLECFILNNFSAFIRFQVENVNV